MLRQYKLEVTSSIGCGIVGLLLRRSLHHDLVSLINNIKDHMNETIGAAKHIEIVLDHQDQRALVGVAPYLQQILSS
ncbi:MAG: hypothetical protein EBY11_03175 [Proteobacteria bacterium]|nr:hypothetical protein [Pseudomonadota bacterium]